MPFLHSEKAFIKCIEWVFLRDFFGFFSCYIMVRSLFFSVHYIILYFFPGGSGEQTFDPPSGEINSGVALKVSHLSLLLISFGLFLYWAVDERSEVPRSDHVLVLTLCIRLSMMSILSFVHDSVTTNSTR